LVADSVFTISTSSKSARLLRRARERAALTQRQLSTRTAVAQPTIARIERSLVDPRVATLDRLLAACGESLASIELSSTGTGTGAGIDRSQFRSLLRLSPRQRLDLLRDDVAGLIRLEQASRR